MPWLWVCRVIHVLFKGGAFPSPVMAMFHRLCLDARNGMDGCQMQLNSQLPFSYSHLLSALVQGAVVLASVRCAMLSALADTLLSILCQTVFTTAISMVYLGLLSLSAVIADPFGDDIIDFPASH